ncbi:MAG TPA: group III truncated hemoglobin [Chryseosolibacter sp.]
MKYDIRSRDDIASLINSFYSKVRVDETLSHLFASVDWDHHTPIIINFWTMVLLGDQSYSGNPLVKHMHMNLEKQHFERWLLLFTTTVDQLFEGEKANEAKQRAHSIAGIFQYKLNIHS